MNEHRTRPAGLLQDCGCEVIHCHFGRLDFLGYRFGRANFFGHDQLRRLKHGLWRRQQLRMNRQRLGLGQWLRPQRRKRDQFRDVIIRGYQHRVGREDADHNQQNNQAGEQAVAGCKGPPVPLLFRQQAELKTAIVRWHPNGSKTGAQAGESARGWSLHIRGEWTVGKRATCACPLVTTVRFRHYAANGPRPPITSVWTSGVAQKSRIPARPRELRGIPPPNFSDWR